ncbi:MAG: alpha/beta fold hydrolase [Gemmatimonadota bacterium]
MQDTAGDIRMSWRESGHGAPVILLHAFPLHGAMWEPQLRDLPERWRWVAPDLRGFGETERGDGEGPIGMDLLADDVVALMDHLDIERAAVCGLSMGGYVAFALWNWHPERIDSLVLCDTRAGADTEQGRRDRFATIERVRAAGSAAPLVESLLPKLVSDATRRERRSVVERVRSMIEEAPPESVIDALQGMAERPDSTELLPEIDVPALVVVGEHDPITTRQDAEFLVAEMQDARLAVVPEAAHLSNMEHPRAFNRSLVQFLEAIQGH